MGSEPGRIGLRWVFKGGERVLQAEKLSPSGITWEWVDVPQVYQEVRKESEVSSQETLPKGPRVP